MFLKNIIDEGITNPYLNQDDSEYTASKLKKAHDAAIAKIDKGMIDFGNKYPHESSDNNIYPAVPYTHAGWNQGFWTGMLWLAWEDTKNDKYKELAMKHIPEFYDRIYNKIGVNHHDMGFLYSPSCVAAYKLTGDEQAKEAALLAAEHLTTRYNEKGNFIQAWGDVGQETENRLIVDCLMNIPILYWASELTGDPKYHDMAYKHFRTTLNNTVRENGGSHQTYFFDAQTGAPLYGKKDQGLTDDTTWSRGQGWCVYGMMLTYKYTKDPDAIEVCKKMANYYINRCPEDFIPYWDLDITEGDEPRDSATAALVVCGLIELIKLLDDSDPYKAQYKKFINLTMNSLYDNYATKDVPESNGLLLHATYSVPHGLGVDECNIWGDYYYMEALHKLYNESELYW